jgi:predicted dehydrogenase
MKSARSLSRRDFVKGAAAFGAPLIIPASAIGRDNRPAPSNRINVGFIGVGGMGSGLLRAFLALTDAQVVAVCDVDQERRLKAKSTVEMHYAGQSALGSYSGCADILDFRDVIARSDIDALVMALPDHWHAIPVIMAAKAGKDIYAEKPLGLTVEQGRVMSDTVNRYGRVFQTGSQLRSWSHVLHGIELVRNGRLGKIHTIHAVCGAGPAMDNQPEMPVPPGFDYDMWLGPAPWAPYTKLRCHGIFRWNLDYSGGQITDHGAHYCDLAQWGLNRENSGPVEFEGSGDFPKDGLWNTATTYRVECKYADGVKLIVTHEGRGGATFFGTEGSLYIGDGGIESDPPHLAHSVIGPNEDRVYPNNDHHQNFLDCIKTRRDPAAPIETAHRSVSIGHIGNIAMLLGRKLTWNPETERFVNDPAADRMLSRSMRSPWRL